MIKKTPVILFEIHTINHQLISVSFINVYQLVLHLDIIHIHLSVTIAY